MVADAGAAIPYRGPGTRLREMVSVGSASVSSTGAIASVVDVAPAGMVTVPIERAVVDAGRGGAADREGDRLRRSRSSRG